MGKLFVLVFFILGISRGEGVWVESPVLKPLPQSPSFSFDPMADVESPECGQILERLQNFQNYHREVQFGLIEFMDMSSQRVGEWYGQLFPLEGKKEFLPKGTFQVLSDGSQEMGEITGLAYQNADFLERDLQAIVDAVAQCLPSKGMIKSKQSRQF